MAGVVVPVPAPGLNELRRLEVDSDSAGAIGGLRDDSDIGSLYKAYQIVNTRESLLSVTAKMRSSSSGPETPDISFDVDIKTISSAESRASNGDLTPLRLE